METLLVAHEGAVRVAAFAATLTAFVALEQAFPARARVRSRGRRWFANLALAALSAGLVRLVFPLAAVGMAALAAARGWGVFHVFDAPGWLAGLICILALDLGLYLQHRAMHHAPWLWRLHGAHHADADVDATTGLRFHPLEALVSMLWKAAIVLALGAPVWAVIAFEVALNALSIFNHANLRLGPLQRLLEPWLITPAAHRVHHDRASAAGAAANYGFSLALWDRLFGTWRAGPEPAALGLAGAAAARDAALLALLLSPFARKAPG